MLSVANSNHKIKATNEQIQAMLEYYQGYLTYNTSSYTIARAKLTNVTITFYRTNVVLFQGLDEINEYNIWANKFGLEIEKVEERHNIDYSRLTSIGTDEVGTGDYFGPVVVCATYTTPETIEKLYKLGVKDSKLLTDKQMISLAIQISNIIPYSIIFLDPTKINSLSDKYNNLNFIKAYLHNKAINSILKKLPNVKYDAILIDEFTPKEKYLEYLKKQPNVIENVTMIVRGERENIGIAAASVLARVAFLRELKKMSNEYDMELLKGAGHEVDRTAISFIKSYGFNELLKVAKVKFANTKRIVEYFNENSIAKSRLEGIEIVKQKAKIV